MHSSESDAHEVSVGGWVGLIMRMSWLVLNKRDCDQSARLRLNKFCPPQWPEPTL